MHIVNYFLFGTFLVPGKNIVIICPFLQILPVFAGGDSCVFLKHFK